MNRRKFLHRASAGTIALGSLPLLGSKAWADQDCHDEGKDKDKHFHFVVVAYPVNFPAPGSNDRLLFHGDGTFDEDSVEGGGKFDHWLANSGLPGPIVSSGKWKAKEFVSFVLPTKTGPNPDATHGPFQGGILTLKADFYPKGQSKIKDVVLEIVCNLGPAGAFTPGKDEGVYTTFQGVAFQPPGMGINSGITLFDA